MQWQKPSGWAGSAVSASILTNRSGQLSTLSSLRVKLAGTLVSILCPGMVIQPKSSSNGSNATSKVWCDDCTNYTAHLVKVDEYGDEVLHCPVCRRTWMHP